MSSLFHNRTVEMHCVFLDNTQFSAFYKRPDSLRNKEIAHSKPVFSQNIPDNLCNSALLFRELTADNIVVIVLAHADNFTVPDRAERGILGLKSSPFPGAFLNSFLAEGHRILLRKPPE